MKTKTPASQAASHTPGPWEWFHVGTIPGDGCLRLDAADGTNILITDKTDESLSWNPLPNDANAALIAAAPELLEALRGVLERFEKEYQHLTDGEHGTTKTIPEVKKARAAIAAITRAQPN